MSPMMDEMLVHEVVPRLRNAARSIPKIGHEDDEEIIQDATLMAARMMDSAERAGHPVTAGNVSYYAAKAARSGRRSYYSVRSDVMSPGCQIDGKARHDFMDEEIEFEGGGIDFSELLDGVPGNRFFCLRRAPRIRISGGKSGAVARRSGRRPDSGAGTLKPQPAREDPHHPSRRGGAG